MIQYAHIIFLTVFTMVSALWAVLKNYSEFSPYEMFLYAAYLLGIIFIQSALSLCLMRIKSAGRGIKASIIVAGLSLTFNFFTIIIIHNTRIMGWSPVILYPLIAIYCLTVIGFLFIRNREFIKFVYVALTIFTISISGKFILEQYTSLDNMFGSIPDHFKTVEFKDKPNIYVFTFDTLSPPNTIKNILHIDETMAYEPVIEKFGGISFKNVFAERIPTKRSLGVFLAMDGEYFSSFRKSSYFLRNEVPNPAYHLLRENDYKLQFLYKTSYFGTIKHLDYYNFAEVNGLCEHIDSPYAFAGFCLPAVQSKISQFTKNGKRDYAEFLTERIDYVSQSKEPWFTFAHIYAPGHTKLSFSYNSQEDWDEFRDAFGKHSASAATMMEVLLKKVQEVDPDAIVLVFGDHGPLTTMNLAKDPEDIPDELPEGPLTMEQIVQDKHAVRAALFSKRYCRDSFTRSPYSTMRIMRDLMICLSHGEDPLPADYQPDDSRWEPYLYE